MVNDSFSQPPSLGQRTLIFPNFQGSVGSKGRHMPYSWLVSLVEKENSLSTAFGKMGRYEQETNSNCI